MGMQIKDEDLRLNIITKRLAFLDYDEALTDARKNIKIVKKS